MAWFFLLIGVVFAEPPAASTGTLIIDAKQPVEILLNGVKLAQMYYPGEVTFKVKPGTHVMRLYLNGKATDYSVSVEKDGAVRAFVGRTGVSFDKVTTEKAITRAEVEFRVEGSQPSQLFIGGKRHIISPGERLTLEMNSGMHAFSARNQSGTVIWASGMLSVRGTHVVVQLSEGRMPEITGPGSFVAGG